MKIILTGSNGQLGQCFLEQSKSFPQIEMMSFCKSDLDITKIHEIEQAIGAIEFDIWINCAAYTKVDLAEQEEDLAFQVNKFGVRNIACYCEQKKILLLHFSTDYVYHNKQKRPLKETDLLNPQSIYAKSKLAGEVMVSKYCSYFLIFRTSWVYSMYGENFVKTMLKLANNFSEIKVVNDQIGSPTSAHEIAKQILQMLDRFDLQTLKSQTGAFNISAAGETNWSEFSKNIFELSHNDIKVIPIPSSEYPTASSRPPYSVLDNTKAKNNLSIEMPHWKESLSKCINAYLSNK